jgi:hypothetical protein
MKSAGFIDPNGHLHNWDRYGGKYIKERDQGQERQARGRLSGSPELVAAAIDRARALEGERVGPEEGPYTRTNHLDHALSACIVISDLLIHGTQTYSGDVPMRPSIPAGAVG